MPAPLAPVSPPADGTPVARRSLPLGPLALALVAGSVLLSAGLGYGFGLWMGLPDPWVAGLAASVGMAATALPLGALLLGLARAAEPGLAAVPAGASPLPGAMAREAFLELAEREWARSRRYGSGAALLLVEVDPWPRLLEQSGRAGADAVLGEIVHDTGPTLRGADALAWFGEGQLAVFLAHADATGALDVAERVRERTEMLELTHRSQRLRATVSVGVAHLRPAHLHLQSLIDDAADAVAAARQAGGNCVRAAPVALDRMLGSEALPPRQPDRRARKP